MLSQLRLADNILSGNIPSSLANCPLNWLDLQGNKLTGSVPKEILQIPTLSAFLNLQDNMLSGPLPSEVGSLKNLQHLDISNNKISGEIPESLGECLVLGYLNLSTNLFEASIPSSLSNLRGLEMIDLSYNNLSGHIPEFIGSFSGIIYLSLSFNDFEGAVPQQGIFQNRSAFSITGNSRLCGGIPELRLPPCSNKLSQKHHPRKIKLIILAPIAAALCCIILFSLLAIWFFGCRPLRKSPTTDTSMNEYPRVSYGELARGTEGFSHTNLIGVGSFGSVYKGFIQYDGKGTTVAIKVLNLQQHRASQSFLAECQALGHVRHRNLVKILTVCSSLDSAGNDFKALIYDLIPNGNLDEWIHNPGSRDGKGTLDISQRLNIAIDIASALDYLHNHQSRPIAHCDLKPSNVLLDYDLVAHVADFGLAKFLSEEARSLQNSTSMEGLRGTIGYITPEYGIGNEVSTHGDIFSYGILLLELFTAKRPTDDTVREGLSLHRFVEMALPDRTSAIVDQSLFLTEHSGASKSDIAKKAEIDMRCVTSALTVGIQCSKQQVSERMQIAGALREMHRIRGEMSQTMVGSSN
uniref:Uncharacterized protein n=1 Tax=Avena sativa TaxID=4498 RepID=A0ACD5TYB2_AVESA